MTWNQKWVLSGQPLRTFDKGNVAMTAMLDDCIDTSNRTRGSHMSM